MRRPLVAAFARRSFASGGGSPPAAQALPFYQRHPVVIAVAVATAKTSIADILVQTQLEKREHVDWKR
eukprot:COSAG05_NODE_13885_length_415_cov_0.819620_1_plen_67_part_01